MSGKEQKLFRKILFYAGILLFCSGIIYTGIGCLVYGAVQSVGNTCLFMVVSGLFMMCPAAGIDMEI